LNRTIALLVDQKHSLTPLRAIVDWLTFGGNIIETGTASPTLAHRAAM
jgi:hypothetical protein